MEMPQRQLFRDIQDVGTLCVSVDVRLCTRSDWRLAEVYERVAFFFNDGRWSNGWRLARHQGSVWWIRRLIADNCEFNNVGLQKPWHQGWNNRRESIIMMLRTLCFSIASSCIFEKAHGTKFVHRQFVCENNYVTYMQLYESRIAIYVIRVVPGRLHCLLASALLTINVQLLRTFFVTPREVCSNSSNTIDTSLILIFIKLQIKVSFILWLSLNGSLNN